MAFKTKKEKTAYKIGLKRGKKLSSKPEKKKKMKMFSFQAFNSNCDVFNVDVKGYSRKEALDYARKHLKKDPEHKNWDVSISDAKADKDNFFRTVTVHRTGKSSDNWKPYYGKE